MNLIKLKSLLALRGLKRITLLSNLVPVQPEGQKISFTYSNGVVFVNSADGSTKDLCE